MMAYRTLDPATAMGGGSQGSTLPGLGDYVRFLEQSITTPLMSVFRQAAADFSNLSGAYFRPSGAASHRKAAHAADCCHDVDPCHCACCIVDADLVVYARLGERRLVPVMFENRWRRERKIKLELSAFTTRGGGASLVKGTLLPPAPEFVLPPCGEQTIVLALAAAAGDANEKESLPDVDDCLVSYADLRAEGCDVRPVRIAVALLPRDCHGYHINCRCDCC